ncbi:hypothetical protein [Pseudoalteromonas sp. GB56]
MIQFNKNRIEINGNTIELQHSILDAKELNQRIYVILDYMEFDQYSVARNLQCLNPDGSVTWVAENPTTQSSDAYVNFSDFDLVNNFVVANNFAGFKCYIELATGKLLKSEFTK